MMAMGVLVERFMQEEIAAREPSSPSASPSFASEEQRDIVKEHFA